MDVTIMVKCPIPFHVNLEKVERYLTANQWKEDDKVYGPYGRIFRKGAHRLLLLHSYEPVDFSARMAEFVCDLAEAEGRPARDVIQSLEVMDEA